MLKKIFFYFAVTCWCLSLIVHLLSVVGYDISYRFPYTWILHVFLVFAFVPAMIYLMKGKKLMESLDSGWVNPFNFLKDIFKNSPVWLTTICAVCFIYAFINFSIFSGSYTGNTEIKDGQYILQDRGSFVRAITEEEYHQYGAAQTRGFSGHWLIFYSISAAILYPYKRNVPECQD